MPLAEQNATDTPELCFANTSRPEVLRMTPLEPFALVTLILTDD